MQSLLQRFSRITEAIAAGMLAAIFGIFLLQIALRYLFTPAGWTLELIGILWVWVIFFACAFVVREQDQVKFDIIYLSVSRRTRKIFAMISAAVMVIGMLYTLLPTLDYIDWMKIRKTATVENPLTGKKIPMRTIFSIYGVFIVAVAGRYLWLFFDIYKKGPPKTELELAVEAIHEEENDDSGAGEDK
jgi:C4-dicarboxylate transporter DctQ subunit